jgi:hypothetical protein
MNDYDHTQVEDTDLSSGVQYLGTDADGEQHYATTPVGGLSVFVTDTRYDYVAGKFDATVRRYDLEDNGVEDWMRAVAQERGPWQVANVIPQDSSCGRSAEVAD